MCITKEHLESLYGKKLSISEDNRKKYNLQKIYDEVNRKYFGNELMDVPLKWTPQKSTMGKVKFVRSRVTGGKVQIKWLAMSSYYDMNEEQFYSTFIHECIHVYMLQDFGAYSWNGGWHGEEFKTFARQLSQKSGYKITEKNEDPVVAVRKDLVKPFDLLIGYSSGSDIVLHSIAKHKGKFSEDDLERIKERLDYKSESYRQNYEIHLYQSISIPDSYNFVASNDFYKKIQLYRTSKESAEILKNMIDGAKAIDITA